MFFCDICGEIVILELDMKIYFLIVYMENEVICLFCKLLGVNYDEMCFYIEIVYCE